MKLGKAIYTKTTPVLMEACSGTVSEEIVVRIIAIAEGYAMVRRKGAMPFVCTVKELSQVTR